jgi:toxin ParE1/3/4
MATEVKWSEKASSNLLNIYQYIASDSIFYAQRFTKNLVLAVEGQLKRQPLSGRNVPEFQDSRLNFLKEVLFRGYRIIYNPSRAPAKITIIAVLNAKMDTPRHIPEDWVLD